MIRRSRYRYEPYRSPAGRRPGVTGNNRKQTNDGRFSCRRFIFCKKRKNFAKPLDKPVSTVYTVYIQLFTEVTGLNLFIENRSGIPIYEQVYGQIKAQIISGALAADAPLPSIRNLAKDLRISVITTKRAYDELEKEGFLYTVAGKGCFVAPKNVELLREDALRKIEEHFDQILQLAASCDLKTEDLVEMLRTAAKEAL